MIKISAWLSIGSTYTYLTALRIKGVCAENNIALDIKPISIRQIMKSMDNIPFPPSKKAKVDYMWRDIERRAAFYGLTVRKPRRDAIKHMLGNIGQPEIENHQYTEIPGTPVWVRIGKCTGLEPAKLACPVNDILDPEQKQQWCCLDQDHPQI